MTVNLWPWRQEKIAHSKRRIVQIFCLIMVAIILAMAISRTYLTRRCLKLIKENESLSRSYFEYTAIAFYNEQEWFFKVVHSLIDLMPDEIYLVKILQSPKKLRVIGFADESLVLKHFLAKLKKTIFAKNIKLKLSYPLQANSLLFNITVEL